MESCEKEIICLQKLLERVKADLEKQAKCIKELHSQTKAVEAKLRSHGQGVAPLSKQSKTGERESKQVGMKDKKAVLKSKPSSALMITKNPIAPIYVP